MTTEKTTTVATISGRYAALAAAKRAQRLAALIHELLEDEVLLIEATNLPRPALDTIEQRLADTLAMLKGSL